MSESDRPPDQRAVIRWWVFAPVCLLGLGLTALSIVTSVAWNWQGIWPSVFLEFGATILLGALLYVGQRSFVQVVRQETRTVVENVGARTDVVERQLGEQAARIETLAMEVEHARDARHRDEDAAIAAITDEMTYRDISSALRDAERRAAISESFRVRASADLGGMRLYLKNLNLMDRAVGATPFLSLTPWFLDGRRVQPVSWNDGEDVTTVMANVIARLEEANIDAGAESFDPELVFRNLRRSLTVAIGSRRGEVDTRLRGPLVELVDDRWALTDAGLESRTDDVFVPAERFPATPSGFQDPGTAPFVAPDAPPGLPPDTWHVLTEIARMTYLVHGRRPATRRGRSV